MAELIYDAITSLDGYVVDADGNWTRPRRTTRCTRS